MRHHVKLILELKKLLIEEFYFIAMPHLADIEILVKDDQGNVSFEEKRVVNLALVKHSVINRIYKSK